MKAVITSRFLTAEETGRILGVPASRVKKLIRLVDPNHIGRSKSKVSSRQHKVTASRKGRTRGKMARGR